MTELDAEIGPLALEIIDQYGKLVAYSFTQAGEYQPESASVDAGPPLPLNVKAAVEDIKGKRLRDGSIESADKKLTIAAQSFLGNKPETGNTFVVDGDTFTVLDDGVKAIYSGELIAIYEIRGGK